MFHVDHKPGVTTRTHAFADRTVRALVDCHTHTHTHTHTHARRHILFLLFGVVCIEEDNRNDGAWKRRIWGDTVCVYSTWHSSAQLHSNGIPNCRFKPAAVVVVVSTVVLVVVVATAVVVVVTACSANTCDQ